jgi:hypothetical protein
MAASSSEDIASVDNEHIDLQRMIADGSLAQEAERCPETKLVYEQLLAVVSKGIRDAAEAGSPHACLMLAKQLRHDPSINPASHSQQLDYVEVGAYTRPLFSST